MHIIMQLQYPSNKYLVVQIKNDRVCGVMNGYSIVYKYIRLCKNAFMYVVKIDWRILYPSINIRSWLILEIKYLLAQISYSYRYQFRFGNINAFSFLCLKCFRYLTCFRYVENTHLSKNRLKFILCSCALPWADEWIKDV